MPDFASKLANAQQIRKSKIALFLNPRIDTLPLPMQRYDDPFLPFSRAIIEATEDVVCAYIFDFASYMALAAAGARALERAIGIVGQNTIKILHGPFVGQSYSAMLQRTAFDVDAVTVFLPEDVEFYETHAPFGAIYSGPLIANSTVLVQQSLQLKVTDNSLLYADLGNDFADALRVHVIKLNANE